MASNRISVRLPATLTERLRKRSRIGGKSESELVREALEGYLAQGSGEVTAYELAKGAGIIGTIKNLPKDLSTNRRYFKGFGKSK